ncbi:hypothetical protein V496_01606 [Pseudogymnoascus sp. VKM F-4515 (FW-2607)]|nr:hypothetical protein V496_01606 [Pseudogymnoascus sp. VKM F-4515 (FW-2607)]
MFTWLLLRSALDAAFTKTVPWVAFPQHRNLNVGIQSTINIPRPTTATNPKLANIAFEGTGIPRTAFLVAAASLLLAIEVTSDIIMVESAAVYEDLIIVDVDIAGAIVVDDTDIADINIAGSMEVVGIAMPDMDISAQPLLANRMEGVMAVPSNMV